MARLIIRRMRLAHCKRGPEICEECRRLDARPWCLLDIDPEDRGLMQRRSIEVEIGGSTEWREFDVVKVFADENEARGYAMEHLIDDVGE